MDTEFTRVGATLQWANSKNKLKYRIGAQVAYYANDPDTKNVYYYPALEIAYYAKKKQIIPYLKATGNLTLNTYRNFSKRNPFVAPALVLTPTNHQYKAQIGFRTNATAALVFDFNIGYDQFNHYPIFKKSPYNHQENLDGYQWGNSFDVRYHNVDVLSGAARLSFALGSNNQLVFYAKYAEYSLENNATPWNIPALTAGLEGNFNIANTIAIHLNTKLIGERNGASQEVIMGSNTPSDQSIENLPMFLQSNLHINGKLSSHWDIFLKGNFNSAENHGEWIDYPVNQWLAVAGITYKFDVR